MGDEAVALLRHLRSQARKLGLAIRTQTAARTSGSRAYALIDRESGRVVKADLPNLVEVQTQLWWIVRNRKREQSSLLVNEVRQELCPTCGTPRVAFFALCLSCGLDYEATRAPTPDNEPKPRWNGPSGGLYGGSLPQAQPIEPLASAQERIASRLAALAHEVGYRLQFGSLRQLAGGAIFGLIVGAIVALLGATR